MSWEVRQGPAGFAHGPAIRSFAQTSLPIIDACPGGSHYLDLSNELPSVINLLQRHEDAVASKRCLVAGAGWGVLATESVVLKLRADRPAAQSVRVDALPFIDSPGPIGATVAATIVEGLPAGGRVYKDGTLARSTPGADYGKLVLPDGSEVGTGAMPLGDLEAARLASGAPTAVAASSLAPGSSVIRSLMPAVAAICSSRALREFAKRRIAKMIVPPATEQKSSWAHARLEWADGTVREGWLRAGEGMDFTARVAAEVASRLAKDEGSPGAYTPGALFGADLAVRAGGAFMLS